MISFSKQHGSGPLYLGPFPYLGPVPYLGPRKDPSYLGPTFWDPSAMGWTVLTRIVVIYDCPGAKCTGDI